jgi:hypothetical protein
VAGHRSNALEQMKGNLDIAEDGEGEAAEA